MGCVIGFIVLAVILYFGIYFLIGLGTLAIGVLLVAAIIQGAWYLTKLSHTIVIGDDWNVREN